MSLEEEDIYYSLGNYVYNVIHPTVCGDVEIFKYILGRIILNKI